MVLPIFNVVLPIFINHIVTSIYRSHYLCLQVFKNILAFPRQDLCFFFAFSTHFVNDFLQSIIPATYPILQQTMGFSFFEIGVISFFLQLTSSIFQPFIGLRNDTGAKTNLLLLSGLSTVAGITLFSQSSALSGFILAVSFIGVGSALFHPTMSKIAQTIDSGKRGLNQAVFQVGGNAGGIFGPIATAVFLLPLGLESTLWFGLSALLIVGSAVFLSSLSGPSSVNSPIPFSKNQLRGFFSKSFVILFALMFSKQIYTSSIVNFLSFFLIEKFSFSVSASQYCLFLVLAAGVVGCLVGGVCTDKVGKKKMILFSILGAAPFALLLPFGGPISTVVLASITALIVSSAFSAILVYAFDLMPNNIGAVSGIFFGLCFGLGGLGTIAIGLLADIIGICDVFVYIAFLPLLGGLAIFLPKDK